jgi:DNA helicase-2/ATP-dependent DNA helicase PcrA
LRIASARKPPSISFLSGLNPAQLKAATTTEGPLLVLAGAGTGKTRVITTRIAYLLSRGVHASNVLAMTFTNRAAREMRERVNRLVGKQGEELTVGTFHSFCVRALRENAKLVGLPVTFTICDASDQLAAIKSVMRELRVHESAMHPAAVQARISLAKNRLETQNDVSHDLVADVWTRYQEYLTRTRSVDFDDLLLMTLRLLQSSSEVKSRFRDRYRYVLVDEYQDTNRPQYEIVREICSGHRNICVVGDDDQSIYGWRGADIQKILGFDRDFKGATVVRLETNYRSTTPILDAANAVIRQNPSRHEKTLHSARGDGSPVRLTRLRDEMMEAQFVVEEIQKLVRRGESKLEDIAVLFRTQVQPRAFEAELRGAGIPYVLVGGMSFFDRKEVRDVIAFLKLVVNPDDETAFLRIINTPPRGIGKTTIDKAVEAATERGVSVRVVFDGGADLPPAAEEGYHRLRNVISQTSLADNGGDLVAGLKELLDRLDYRAEVRRLYPDPMTREARWAAVEEVFNFAENYSRKKAQPTLSGFLEELALSSGDDVEDRRDDPGHAVTLMTLHSAKGLEFPHVFLVGLEEGLLPHARSVEEGGVEEERRLAYVGITRAMKTLTISYCAERAKYGKRAAAMPSRFLFEMRGKEPPDDWVAVEASSAAVEETPARARTRKK